MNTLLSILPYYLIFLGLAAVFWIGAMRNNRAYDKAAKQAFTALTNHKSELTHHGAWHIDEIHQTHTSNKHHTANRSTARKVA